MRSIKIYNVDPHTGLYQMSATGLLGQVSGSDVLLQKVAKLINTAIGSNQFSPTLGSAIGNKTALTFNTDMGRVEVLIHQAIEDVQNSIIKEQTEDGTTGMTGDQILDRLEVSQILQDAADPTVFYAEILVYTTDGSVFLTTV
jgi:hypothetical protein